MCHKPNQISRSGEQFASPWESVRCLCLAVHVASRLRHGALRGVGQSNGASGDCWVCWARACCTLCPEPRAAWATPVCHGDQALRGFPATLIPAPFPPAHLISLHLSPLFYPLLISTFSLVPSHLLCFIPPHSVLSHPLSFIPSYPTPSHLIPPHPIHSALSHLILAILSHPAHPTIPVSSCPVPVLLSQLSHSTFCCCTPFSPGHLITHFRLSHPVPSYPVLTPITSTSLSAAPAHHGSVCSLRIPHLVLRFQPFPTQRQVLLGNSTRIQPEATGKRQAGADLLPVKGWRSDPAAGRAASWPWERQDRGTSSALTMLGCSCCCDCAVTEASDTDVSLTQPFYSSS